MFFEIGNNRLFLYELDHSVGRARNREQESRVFHEGNSIYNRLNAIRAAHTVSVDGEKKRFFFQKPLVIWYNTL